ncbi:unnamed protein product [Calicophoron daubneyi]|uniref:Intraflagellar transport protein 80 homolog n=1 Tax=Calicophoron daubneyi TaxID=300641 RepID=A0AAV2TH34_CALDB
MGLPIYSLAWGPNSSQILFSLGKQLVLQPLQPNVKPTAWKAHEGIILKVDWSHVTDQIISGAEDCKFKVWDAFGRLLFTSSPCQYPITSLSWSPDGNLFAVGSYDMLRICDKRGWSCAVEKTKTGSLFNVRWSGDGTQVAGAGGNGQVIIGQITDIWMEWNGFEAAIVDERTIHVHNIRNGAMDKLEFRDRVPKASLGFDHLVVATASQCYVYSTKNFNTPAIVDLKEGNVTMIAQCQKYFALVDGTSIYVYTYDARLACSPKSPNLRTDLLHPEALTISNDALAVKNKADGRAIYLFETATGKTLGDEKPVIHTTEVIRIGLDQCGNPLDRRLALIDRNKDLYLMSIRVFGTARKLVKLSTSVTSFVWAETSNLLAAVANDKVSVWFYPNIAFIDSDLLSMTTQEHDAQEEFGKQPELLSFYRDRISICRSDGSIVSLPVSPYPDRLHQLIGLNKWDDALSLCRNVKDKLLWACLAGFATYMKNLEVAEVAFSEIEEVDKVEYLRYIKKLPTKEMRTAEILLFSGEYQDAEGILVQAGLYFRAVMMNLDSYRWERALDLALKYNVAVDIVLSVRQSYLQQFDRTETLEKFLAQPKTKPIGLKELKEKIHQQLEQEEEQAKTNQAGDSVSPGSHSRQAIAT